MGKIKEKMPNLYRLSQDVRDRLNGCILRYDEKLVYCMQETATTLLLYDLKQTTLIKKITVDDHLLDISSIELGYMNLENNQKETVVRYSKRHPQKQYAQGLRPDHISWYTIDGQETSATVGRGIYNYVQEGFADAIYGVFPSFDGIEWDSLNEVALSQMVALKKIDIGLVLVYFRTRNVGYIEPGKRVVKVPDDDSAWVVHRYLQNFSIKYE